MGGISINSGFYWGSTTGTYCAILEGEGVAVDGDAEPSAASGGCSEAEHPQRSKKSSKRAARRLFRAPQGGRGRCCRRLPLERICAQYGFRFFIQEKSKSVASTAKRQRGLQMGKPGSPLPCFASFCRSKRKAPAASGANYAFAKGSATPTGDHKLDLKILFLLFFFAL